MELNNAIEKILKTYNDQKDNITTEEATKMSLIAPLIAALGYNVFDPSEVLPEFTADVGTKKGEKIDYAIKRNGEIIMIIECKCHSVTLSEADKNQLVRYFMCLPDTKIAVLTNGLVYQFYTDIDKFSMLDAKPYFQIDIRNMSSSDIKELARYCKPQFDTNSIRNWAAGLKLKNGIKKYISDQFANPDEHFTKILTKAAHPNVKIVPSLMEELTKLTRLALSEFLNESLNERLSSAMREDIPSDTDEESADKDKTIITTQEEIDGHNIVRAILSKRTNISDIVMRDTQSYCGILYKDNNRTPICRLRFNNPQNLQLGLFDKDKNETRVKLETVHDIYSHAEALIATLQGYLAKE